MITDTNAVRIERARKLITVQEAERCGVDLYYINPEMFPDPAPVLLAITNEKGYDDVFCLCAAEKCRGIGKPDHGNGWMHEYLCGNCG